MQAQQVHRHDNSIALHMRSAKYRKLRLGQLVCVPCQLIRRQASHFVDIEGEGVQLVIGCNGWLWVGVANKAAAAAAAKAKRSAMHSFQQVEEEPEDAEFVADAAQWEVCARYAAAARALAQLSLPVFRESLQAVVEQSMAQQVSCTDMLGMDFLTLVVSVERSRRSAMDTGDG
jgi:exosome complex component RRP4